MKTSAIALLAALFLPFSVRAQNEVRDAIFLRQYLKPLGNGATVAQLSASPEEQSTYLEILLRYAPNPDNAPLDQAVNDAFFGNPFLSDQQGAAKILLPDVYHSTSALRRINYFLSRLIQNAVIVCFKPNSDILMFHLKYS